MFPNNYPIALGLTLILLYLLVVRDPLLRSSLQSNRQYDFYHVTKLENEVLTQTQNKRSDSTWKSLFKFIITHVWSMGLNYSVTPDSSSKETVLWRLGAIIHCFLISCTCDPSFLY